jgi:hypothetical protein
VHLLATHIFQYLNTVIKIKEVLLMQGIGNITVKSVVADEQNNFFIEVHECPIRIASI